MHSRSIFSVALIAAISSQARSEIIYGGSCQRLTDGQCGNSCTQCQWSWDSADPQTYGGSTADCRCNNSTPAPGTSDYPPLTVNVDGVDKTLYVQFPSWSSAATSGADLTFDYNNRLYLSESDTLDRDQLFSVNLLGGVMDFDVDLSEVGCGCISALYTVVMPAVDNTSDDFGYCDANQVGGHWCPEFDIMEANKYAFHVTGHKCDAPNPNGVYDNCDRGGQCTMDVLTNDLQNDFGPSSSNTIDTAKPFHVKTEFHESGGQFIGYTTTLTQEGRELVLSTGQCDYLQNMSQDMTRMQIVFSQWSSDSLYWLQKDTCSGTCSNTATVNSFSNLVISSTGAGSIDPPSPPSPPTPPTPPPEPTDFVWGDDCNNLDDQLCGDSCAQCTWSWGVGDSYDGPTASCRCKVQADETYDPLTEYRYANKCNSNQDQSLCTDGCDCHKSWPHSDSLKWKSPDAACRCLPKQRAPDGYTYRRECKTTSHGACDGCASCKWSYPTDDPRRWQSAEYMCRCEPETTVNFNYSGECGQLYDDYCDADCHSCKWSTSPTGTPEAACRCPAEEIREVVWGDNVCGQLDSGLCGSYCRECRWSWEATDTGQWAGNTATCRCRNWWGA